MATRVEKILSNARLTLADPKKERWDDDTLLAILNEAQIDFCQQTQMLHERIDVPIIIGNPYFSLPDDCWQLTRVLYDNSPLPLVTHHELDNTTMSRRFLDFGLPTAGSRWEVTKGEPQAIIYDRRNMLEGKIYPIPDRPLEDTAYNFVGTPSETFFQTELYGVATLFVEADLVDTYGVVSSLADLTQDTNLTPDYGVVSALTIADQIDTPKDGFGIIVDITDYEFEQTFGTVVDITDDAVVDTFEDTYGFVDTMVEACSFLKCYYLRNPIDLVDLNSEMSLPAMYDIALKFYVCGQAFLNDIDTGYQQKGAAQMMIYERHLKTAKKDSMKDWTRAGQFETTYRRGF
jgi:hypothetical protein